MSPNLNNQSRILRLSLKEDPGGDTMRNHTAAIVLSAALLGCQPLEHANSTEWLEAGAIDFLEENEQATYHAAVSYIPPAGTTGDQAWLVLDGTLTVAAPEDSPVLPRMTLLQISDDLEQEIPYALERVTDSENDAEYTVTTTIQVPLECDASGTCTGELDLIFSQTGSGSLQFVWGALLEVASSLSSAAELDAAQSEVSLNINRTDG